MVNVFEDSADAMRANRNSRRIFKKFGTIVMKKLEEKFILLLADSSYKEREIKSFIKKLNNGGLDHCFNTALKIRNDLKNADNNVDIDLDLSASDYNSKVVQQVELLLKTEAGMNVKQATNALSKELNVKIPSSNRSFRDKILFLCKKFEGSQIINAAYKIRNSVLPDHKESHWPLKNG